MNQAQRNFLIKKIETNAENKISALKQNEPEYPNLEKYLLNAVLSEKFELQSSEHIRQAIINKVLKMKERDTLLGDGGGWSRNGKTIIFNVDDIFIVPSAFKELKEKYQIEKFRIEEQIKQIRIQSDTLITRIQLASDKTLEKMINEIDDMGDISLMDTKLKLLTNG